MNNIWIKEAIILVKILFISHNKNVFGEQRHFLQIAEEKSQFRSIPRWKET